MTETKYTSLSAQENLQRAFFSICENFLLPSQERAQLIDALKRATTMADPFYGDKGSGARMEPPGFDSFGEGAAKIVACADELLVAMKEHDVLYVAKQGDWGALAACLREYPAIFLKEGVLDFIIEVLDGKRRPPRRPPSAKIAARNREIAWFVLMERERGVGDDPSIENAAKKFNLGKRAIQGIASSEALDSQRPILARVKTLQQDIDELIAKLTAFHETKCAVPFAK
jgi:hypothetical protein